MFLTSIPFAFAAGISILSTPTPALITNFNLLPFAFSETSAVTFVADLTIKTSYSLTASPKSACST